MTVRVFIVSPSKPVRQSNACPSKLIRSSSIYFSNPAYPSNDCQSKLVSPSDVCLQNPRFVTNTLIFNLFLALSFSTLFKLGIVTLNIFITLMLLKTIFLTNFTWLRKQSLKLVISLNCSYLHSMLDSYHFSVFEEKFVKRISFLTSVQMFRS